MQLRPMILVACVALAGCVTTEEQKKALQQGYAFYSNRQLDEAEAAANQFIKENPDSPNVDEALYLRGVARLSRGGGQATRQAAAADLRAAIEKSKRGDLRMKAYRSLGDIAFEAADWKGAREDYERALAGGGAAAGAGTVPVPEATATYLNYRIGACLQAVGQWDQGRTYLQRVVVAANDGYLVERAIARMNLTSFSLQFGAFQDGRSAGTLLTQLKAGGVTATAGSELREGKLLYLVRSGTYATWQEASAARDKLQAKYPLVAIVP